MSISQSKISNALLRLLSPADFGKLANDLEPMRFPQGFVFGEPDQAPSHSYFIESGVGSIVATSPEGQQAEVGLFGRDGMTPTSVALEVDAHPHSVFMQVPGHGYRIATAPLMVALNASPAMQKLFARYAHTLSTQTAFTALSNAVHHVEERLARWILMCHDRLDGQSVELTHEFLSIMLAVRRPSVTTALHVLEGNRFITSSRGIITVRDRAAMEAYAADAYGAPEREYQRLIGPLR